MPSARSGRELKALVDVLSHAGEHWVGDGFPVRTVFFYEERGQELSPFLLLDLAGPHRFAPARRARGVGPHPHRGFETVTIVYAGEVAHQDSTGRRGVIGPGDVQWMTAGAGVLHQEFHSPAFMRSGGLFEMAQLWVNLPAAEKLTAPRYQAIEAESMPVVELEDGAGRLRVIAGSFGGQAGPAKTFSPLNLWDLALTPGARTVIEVPDGHTTVVVVLSGRLVFDAGAEVGEAQAALLSRAGRGALLVAGMAVRALVLTGEPIEERIVGRGPFVMNSEADIRQAFMDFGRGRFGAAGRGQR
jgi:redox-sensitive bicupin YhaK (pirin superfamily)